MAVTATNLRTATIDRPTSPITTGEPGQRNIGPDDSSGHPGRGGRRRWIVPAAFAIVLGGVGVGVALSSGSGTTEQDPAPASVEGPNVGLPIGYGDNFRSAPVAEVEPSAVAGPNADLPASAPESYRIEAETKAGPNADLPDDWTLTAER